jgi:hypothetical protein
MCACRGGRCMLRRGRRGEGAGLLMYAGRVQGLRGSLSGCCGCPQGVVQIRECGQGGLLHQMWPGGMQPWSAGGVARGFIVFMWGCTRG